jgi:hypothetical protein
MFSGIPRGVERDGIASIGCLSDVASDLFRRQPSVGLITASGAAVPQR